MHSIPEEMSRPQLQSTNSKNGDQGIGALQESNIGSAKTEDRQRLGQEQSVLADFIDSLVESGKNEHEITTDLEKYFSQLTKACDDEILDLTEQLEFERGAFREEAAEEVYLKANELDELSNLFIECIHAQRKSLR